jgi:membrane protease YdiL (CAAX protease family)
MLKMKEQPIKQQMKEPTEPPTHKGRSFGRRILMFPLTRLLIAATMFAIVFCLLAFIGGFIDGFSGLDLLSDGVLGDFDFELGLALAGIITLVLMSKVIERRSLAEVGLGYRGLLRHTFLGFGIGTATLLLIILVLKLADFLGVIAATPDDDLAYNTIYWQQLGVFGYLTAAFVFTCFVAVAEEIIFRGFLFRILEEGLGSWLALPISALLFGMIHMTNYSSGASLITVMPQIAMGLSLAAAYMLTRKLWLSIGIHWAWDFTLTAATGGDIFQDDWGAATSLDPSDMVLIGFNLILAIVFLALAVRRGQIRTPSWMQRKRTQKRTFIDENAAPLLTREKAVEETGVL